MEGDYSSRLARIADLLEELEAAPDPAFREAARELVRTLLELHERGLRRVLELSSSDPRLQRALTGSGRVVVVAAPDERDAIRAERADQQENARPSTRSAFGVETDAELMLGGVISSIEDHESGKAVYELNEGKHHDHLVCMQCGRVEEFFDAEIEKRQQRIARERGFEIAEHALYLYAECTKPRCPHRKGSGD